MGFSFGLERTSRHHKEADNSANTETVISGNDQSLENFYKWTIFYDTLGSFICVH